MTLYEDINQKELAAKWPHQSKFVFDNILIIHTYIRNRNIWNNDDDYVRVHYSIWRKLLGRQAEKYKYFMLENGLLESNGSYSDGTIGEAYSTGYRIPKRLKSHTYMDFSNKPAQKRWEKHREEVKARIQKQKESDVVYNYLTTWIEEVELDSQAAYDATEQVEDYDKYVAHRDAIKDFDMDRRIRPRDKFGNRIFSAVQNMPSYLREHLHFGGNKLVEIDIKNSQLFFLASLFANDYKKPHTLSHLKDKEDVQEFIELAYSGRYYEKIQEELGLTRDEAKLFTMKVLFSEKSNHRIKKEKFGSIFPSILDMLDTKVHGRNLAGLLQTLESNFVIDKVGKMMIDNGCEPFLTIHDSFMVHKKDVELLHACIDDVCEEMKIKRPTFK